jgi:hypothetical protein
MQIAEVVRTLGLCSLLGLAGFAVGCGSDAGQGGSGDGKKGVAIQEEQKNARKEARAARAADIKNQRAGAKQSKDPGAPEP